MTSKQIWLICLSYQGHNYVVCQHVADIQHCCHNQTTPSKKFCFLMERLKACGSTKVRWCLRVVGLLSSCVKYWHGWLQLILTALICWGNISTDDVYKVLTTMTPEFSARYDHFLEKGVWTLHIHSSFDNIPFIIHELLHLSLCGNTYIYFEVCNYAWPSECEHSCKLPPQVSKYTSCKGAHSLTYLTGIAHGLVFCTAEQTAKYRQVWMWTEFVRFCNACIQI